LETTVAKLSYFQNPSFCSALTHPEILSQSASISPVNTLENHASFIAPNSYAFKTLRGDAGSELESVIVLLLHDFLVIVQDISPKSTSITASCRLPDSSPRRWTITVV
jgi:hypothetical protein